MSISVTLIWILVALIAALIIASIFELSRRNRENSSSNRSSRMQATNSQIESFLSDIQNVEDFGPIKPASGERGKCNIYTFPGGPERNDPALPKYSKDELDSLTPEPIIAGSCLDPDQLGAQRASRTCNKDGGCTNPDGTTTSKGAEAVDYFACNSNNTKDSVSINACKSTLSLIALPYFPSEGDSSFCLSFNATTKNFLNIPCSLADQTQLFRITRANPKTLAENPNGPYGKIVYRATDECVAPAQTSGAGSGALTLKNCKELPNEGTVWFFAPPIKIDEANTPQQIVYSGSETRAITSAQFRSLIESSQEVNSIGIMPFAPGSRQGVAALQPFSTDSNTDPSGLVRNTQLVDYTLFNLILTAPFEMNNFPFPIWNWTV